MWTNDTVQFARLIAEFAATGRFDSDAVASVSTTARMRPGDIIEVKDRAVRLWEEVQRHANPAAWVEETLGSETLSAPADTQADAVHQLAYGYALGVLHAQPQGVSYGVRSEQDAAEFARTYRAHFERGTFTREVSSAFGEWRTTGSVIA
ncbi:hypothetical protein AB0A63_13865 [Lentzea sp. NPDC042327]|uniref:hypothetical protein n=1 Tax=Lentzea sp. NPDC042327 TaxID=3154801 RepID=UPI0033D09D8E